MKIHHRRSVTPAAAKFLATLLDIDPDVRVSKLGDQTLVPHDHVMLGPGEDEDVTHLMRGEDIPLNVWRVEANTIRLVHYSAEGVVLPLLATKQGRKPESYRVPTLATDIRIERQTVVVATIHFTVGPYQSHRDISEIFSPVDIPGAMITAQHVSYSGQLPRVRIWPASERQFELFAELDPMQAIDQFGEEYNELAARAAWLSVSEALAA